MNTAQHRTVDWRIVVGATSPFLWLALLYSFVLRARLHLGVWPYPYQPDPKSLGFDVHHLAIYLGVPAMSAAGIYAVVVSLVRCSRGARVFRGLPLVASDSALRWSCSSHRLTPDTMLHGFSTEF